MANGGSCNILLWLDPEMFAGAVAAAAVGAAGATDATSLAHWFGVKEMQRVTFNMFPDVSSCF